jgi:C4-dicarboxylate-specific signal transduction histidine kinase
VLLGKCSAVLEELLVTRLNLSSFLSATTLTNQSEKKKRRIAITSHVIADQIEITFADAGCGIPQKIRVSY